MFVGAKIYSFMNLYKKFWAYLRDTSTRYCPETVKPTTL